MRVVVRRTGGAILAAAAALLPVAATAQSAGCARVNGGSLNYEADFRTGNLDRATSRFSTAVSDQAVNSIRITAASDQSSGTAAYDTAGNFAFSPGDRLITTATYENFTAGNVIVRFRIGTTATSAADVTNNDIVLQSGSGTVMRSYTVSGSETAIGVRTFRQLNPATTPTGNVDITVTCTPAPIMPAVTTQPSNQAVGAGETASFTAAVSGSPEPTVQWQVSNTNGGFDDIVGATSPTYSFAAAASADNKRYRAVFTNSEGTATTDAATLTVVAATQISKTSGPQAGGTEVTISGTGFTETSTAAFGATPATSVTFVRRTELRATSPNGTGTVNVRVTTNDATSPTGRFNAFTYVADPVVNLLTPSSGPASGGNRVEIVGQNLATATTVKFGSADATGVDVRSDTLIYAVAPAGSGQVFVTVTNVNGTSATGSRNQYTYVGQPTVTSISPTAGPTAGGTGVTITGTNLSNATSVTFGTVTIASSNFLSNSATAIRVASPQNNQPGTVDIRVTTAGGTSAASAGDQFTYVPAPTVTSVTPNSGRAAGGTVVTVAGGNFAGATAVRFGSNNATNVVVAGDGNSLTATTPAGTVGAVAVRVSTPGGTGQLADAYTYVAAPTIVVAPAALPQAVANQQYLLYLSASGGTGPYTFSASGSLPPGITLSDAGVLSGTPTAPGSFGFTVTATDNATGGGPYSGSRTYTLVVRQPPITITPTSLPNGAAETPYSATLSVSGGTGPYTFAVTSGTLPSGLVLSSSGVLSGTPSEEETSNFTVTASDGSSPAQTGSQAYTLVIGARAGGATRTWVSSDGLDTNTCSRAAPCATFQAALDRTAAGGQVNCVDTGAYGTLNITRAVSVVCGDKPGQAGVIASGGDAVTVAAGAGDRVLLSGLDLEGVGNSAEAAGVNGVRFTSGGSLVIRNTTVRGFRGNGVAFEPVASASLELHGVAVVDSGSAAAGTSAGVLVRPSATGVTARTLLAGVQVIAGQQFGVRLEATAAGSQVVATVTQSVVSGNANSGVLVRGEGGSVQVAIDGATLTGNAAGVSANGTTMVTVANSTISGNAVGLSGTGAINSGGNNSLSGNTSNGAFLGSTPNQ